MTNICNLFYRVHKTQYIGDVRHANNPGTLADKGFQLLGIQPAVFIYFPHYYPASLSLAKHLPWHNIGMMFALSYDYLVTLRYEGFSKTECHESESCSGS